MNHYLFPIVLAAAFVTLYWIFCRWHSQGGGKLTKAEIDRYIAFMEKLPLPAEEIKAVCARIRRWAEADDGKPVYMPCSAFIAASSDSTSRIATVSRSSASSGRAARMTVQSNISAVERQAGERPRAERTATHLGSTFCVSFASLLSLGCGPVSFLDCVSFAHVLALLGRAVKTRAFLVINVCLGVDPHQTTSAAWCRSRRASAAASNRCCGRRRTD
jgi:hypothetical protein